MLSSGGGFKRISIGKDLRPTFELLNMIEVAKKYEFLKALPPELREKIELDIMKAELERQIQEVLQNIKPGFGGKATSEELDEYADEVCES